MFFKKLLAPLEKLRQGLAKTRDKLSRALLSVLSIGRKIDDDLLDELEELLISADLGVEISAMLVERLKQAYKMREVGKPEEIVDFLKAEMISILDDPDRDVRMAEKGLTVILVVGVNGSGKTTTVAKMARMFTSQGQKVMLAACDTFRAAASEQLAIWGERVGCPVIRHEEGADPAAVAYDACEAALARGFDVLIVDTAGRLHTKTNLMKEMEKIARVVAKKVPGAPHETLLVLDGTTGQNALSQVRTFNSSIPLTGLAITKLDGTAKGGIALAIRSEIKVPLKFIGIGEQMDDMHPFEPRTFVEAIFS
ncbi:MAG: signal recognition particle-docking protein FtsY [Candidatus Brocadiia bacterium]